MGTAGVGKQMRDLLLANLHLFSTKQQRALQADSSKYNAFAGTTQTGRSPDDQVAGKESGSSSHHRRQRHRSNERSDSPHDRDVQDKNGRRTRQTRNEDDRRRYARGAADDFVDERQTEPRSRSRSRSDSNDDNRRGEQKSGNLR